MRDGAPQSFSDMSFSVDGGSLPGAVDALERAVPAANPAGEDEALAAIYRQAMADDPTADTGALEPPHVSEDLVELQGGDLSAAGPDLAGEAADSEADADRSAAPADADGPSQGHFRGWSPQKREAFARMPREAQDFLIAHQRDLISQHSRREAELVGYARGLRPIADVMQQHGDYLDEVSRAVGLPAENVLSNLMQTEATLRFGSAEEKLQTLLGLAADYGVHLPANDTPGAWLEPSAAVHAGPESFTQSRSEHETGPDAAYQYDSVAADEVQRAATRVDPSGQLLFPNFDLHRSRMSELIASGQAASIDEAYRIADAPMRQAIEQQVRARLKKDAAQSASRAARLNVTSAAGAVDRFASEDDMLRSVYRRAQSA